MNGRDMMPACARIAAVDPAMADRMWNTTTDDDGRDLVDERMRGKGRMLCAACPMRLDCISRALVGGWKDKAVYGGLDYASRWILARLIARDLHIADGACTGSHGVGSVTGWPNIRTGPNACAVMAATTGDGPNAANARAANTRPTIRCSFRPNPCRRAWSRAASSDRFPSRSAWDAA